MHHFTDRPAQGPRDLVAAEPLYVVKLDADRQAGARSGREPRSTAPALTASRRELDRRAAAGRRHRARSVQIRSRHAAAAARGAGRSRRDRMAVEFDAPQTRRHARPGGRRSSRATRCSAAAGSTNHSGVTPRSAVDSHRSASSCRRVTASQVALGVEGGHAAGAGGGDGLPVGVVLHVAAREHAGHVRASCRRGSGCSRSRRARAGP
ncbi:MAG: hypothetical protein MZV64_72840 [Ignavibacteriales bacterium]|nr:hypothetical protein [Ignavibacteriales bacterium]